MRFTREGLLTALLVVAALFVGSAIMERLPSTTDVYERPYEHAVAIGEDATLRTGVVKVTGVRAAEQVRSSGRTAATEGVWLVADLEWTPTREAQPLSLSSVRVEDAEGNQYGGLGPITASCGPGQPGITLLCQVPVEVPKDAVPGATLRIPALGSVNGPDDVAVVDLGLTEESVAAPEKILALKAATEEVR